MKLELINLEKLLMDNNIKSSLEKIGYKKLFPKDFNINDYDVISLTEKNGNKINLYRNKKEKQKLDDNVNFSSSWRVFNSHL